METSFARLNLKDALHLYEILGEHIPKDIDENEPMLDFVGQIVDSIVNANEHRRYIDAVILMTGKDQSELLSMAINDVLVLFTGGIIENRILLLCRFCEEIGYGRS